MYSICSFFYATFICNALLISLETQISGKKKLFPIRSPYTKPSFLNTGERWEHYSNCNETELDVFTPPMLSLPPTSVTGDRKASGISTE